MEVRKNTILLALSVFITGCTIKDKTSVDSHIMRGLIRTESGWNPKAISSSGAVGLAQILPSTAKAECGLTRSELFIPEKNIKCGEKYLNKAIARNNGQLNCATITLYNTGIYAKPRCSSYGKTVLKYAEIEKQNPFSTVPFQFRSLVD